MRYIIKKLCVLLATLFVVSLLAFFAFQLIPGDPTTGILGTSATPERVAALRAELGLDRPVFLRYFLWLGSFFTGGGRSYSYAQSVSSLLSGKLPITLTLSAMAFVLVAAISLPLGIFLARREGSVLDRVLTAFNQLVMALPPFFAGILLIWLFGLVLKLFTPGNFVPLSQDPAGYFTYLFFAALAIALPRAAMAVKLLRAGLFGEMRKDYIRTAYSRGNSRRSALMRHALKNAVLPMVTFLAMTLGDIVAGSVIAEQVFSIPGVGRLLLASIGNRDYPVVQSIVVLIACIVIGLNFLADLLSRALNPRLREN